MDPGTGTIRARAVLANPDRMFTPGLFARVQLEGSGEFKALLIDDKAVLTDQDRKYVYVLGTGQYRAAQGRDPGPRWSTACAWSKAAWSPGDKVVVDGVQKVFFPGMPVKPTVDRDGRQAGRRRRRSRRNSVWTWRGHGCVRATSG